MGKNKMMRRALAMLLSAAMVFTNLGNTSKVAYGADGNSVDFVISGSDFVSAIEEMINLGAEPVQEKDMDFTNGKIEKYYQIFFDGDDPLYEFYPEFDGQSMDADIRVFVRLPKDVDDLYALTGEEEIIFLYINNGEDTISCSTTITMSEGGEKRTKRVAVKDYETAFGDNRIEYKSSGSSVPAGQKPVTDSAEAGEPVTDTAVDGNPGTDGTGAGNPGTDITEAGNPGTDVTEAGNPGTDEDGAGSAGTDAQESPKNETDAEISDSEAAEPESPKAEKEEAEAHEPEMTENEAAEPEAAEPRNPVASRSRLTAPFVAAVEGGEEDSHADSGNAEQEEKKETKETSDAAGQDNKPSHDQDKVISATEEQATSADHETETEESRNQTESTADESGEESTAAEPSESSAEGEAPSDESQTETSEESQPAQSESGQITESSESQAPIETESQPAASVPEVNVSTPSQPQGNPGNSIGNGDFVGLDGCSSAKAYVTTLKKLKALDDIDGYRVRYVITPDTKASIVNKASRVEEEGTLTFGVAAEEGYTVDRAEANGNVIQASSSEDRTFWYTLEGVEEDQEILITMIQDGTSPDFNKTLSMDDGMDITIWAPAGVLPQDTIVKAEIVTEQMEEVIKADQAAEGQEIIASPAYDINLWLDGEKLDNEVWNQNGAVTVSFSGRLMEQLSQEAQMAQVLWVKDEDNSAEVMEGSQKDISQGNTAEDLSFDTRHFTTFAAVFAAVPDTSNVFDIETHGLMDQGFPKLDIRDKNDNQIKYKITEEDNGTKRVTLENGKPLPRDIRNWFEISYDFKNSQDPFFKEYSVQKGDHFTYQFPANILYDQEQTVVNDINGGDTVIGTASINADGYMDVEITASNVGQNFRGTAEAGGKLDLEKVSEERSEITIKCGEVEYILELEPVPVQEHYSVKVVKGPKAGKWTDQNIRYAENGLPSAIRYDVTVTADAKNSGPLTNVKINDTLEDTKNGAIEFDVAEGIEFKSNNDHTVVQSVTFGNTTTASKGKTIEINLKAKDNEQAAMAPGESISLSYWINIGAGAWGGSKSGNGADKMTASLNLSLKNTVKVTADKKVTGSDSTTFNKTIECVTKSGIVHYNYEIDGENRPVVIEYHVFVNPELINMTGWIIEDQLDQEQLYLGNVKVTAYKSKNGAVVEKLPDIEPATTANPQTWKYIVEDPGNYYYDFKYFTTPKEATGSNLSNEIKITWPGGGSGGIGGGTGVGFLYNTYTMTKKNLSSNMNSSNNPQSSEIYLPANGSAGNVGWGEDFGTIRWQSVLTPYAEGHTEGATIPAGTVYKDTLSVIKWGNGNKEDTERAGMHTFRNEDGLKDSFVLIDGNNNSISPDAGVYKISLDGNLGKRGFVLEFLKDVSGPVTIEYDSYVDLGMLGELDASTSIEKNNNLRFKNVGEMTINGTTWQSATSQPFHLLDYISKNWVKNDSATGTITWNLNINKGYGTEAPQKLSRFTVDVIEYIPEGLTLDYIKFQNMNYKLNAENGDYEVDGNKVIIHLNTVAKNYSGYNMDKRINLNVITKVTDPSIKDFVNSAQIVIDGHKLHEVSASTSLDKSFLEKGMEYNRDTAPYAVYTLLINKPGADISNGTLTVLDTIGVPGKMAYLPDSFKVTNSNTGETIGEADIRVGKDSSGNDSFEISNLPDETPIKIVYKVMITGDIGENVNTKNTASLLYSSEGIVTDTIERAVTVVKAKFSGGGDFSIKLFKVDQNRKPLAGSTFTLSKVSEMESQEKIYVGEYTPVIDPGNPQAGAVVLVTGLEKGQLYYLEETAVPEGYQKAEGKYFIIPDRDHGIGVPEGAIAIENAGTPYVVENIKDSGTLKLTKEVTGREMSGDFETDFYFTVYGEGRYYDTDGSYADRKTVKLHYNSTKADNSIVLSLPIGEYRVAEVADADGTPIDSENFYYNVQVNGDKGNETAITIEKEQQEECLVSNAYEADGSIQFTAMKAMEGRPLEEGEFTFRVYEGDMLKAESQNGEGGVILFPEINYKGKDAGIHTYTVVEEKGTLTGITYDETVYTVTVKVTDNFDRTVSAEIIIIEGIDGNEAESILFNNVYEKPTDPDPVPDPTPDPTPDPAPEPGGGTGGGGGGGSTTPGGGRYQPSEGGPGATISIAPEEVPLAQLPGTPDSVITILDDDVPLAPLPKTGDMSGNSYMLAMMSALITGLYLALTKRKRKE